MTGKLDEYPLRAPTNRDVGALPGIKSTEARRVIGGDIAVVNAREWKPSLAALPIEYEWPGEQDRQLGGAIDAQILAGTMRAPLVQGAAGLVDRIDPRRLRPGRGAWQRKIRVAAGLGQDLHFRINATADSANRIGEREVAMDKCVHGIARAMHPREAAVLFRKNVPELFKRLSQVRRRIRFIHSMMQMDFDLAQSFRL